MLTCALSALVLSPPGILSAQAGDRDIRSTPEQRYGDWVRRLDFRAQEYLFRRSNMLRLLRDTGGGVLLVPSSDGVTRGSTFRQLDDFWYYTGLEIPNAMLVLDAGHDRATLFLPSIDYRFEDAERPNDFPGRPLLEDYQLRGMGGIGEYRDMAEFERYLAQRVRAGTTLRINGGSPGVVSTPEVPLFGSLDPIRTMLLRIRSDHPDAQVQNAYEEIARGRMIKSSSEIQRMQIAAKATVQAIRSAANLIRVGADERSIQGEFEATCRALGSQSIPFTPIVKSGPNSLWPWRVLAAHYDRRNRPMEDDELVILDVGCEIGGYVSDVGRTFPVGGSFTEIQREKVMISTNAADAMIAAVRPGITFRELTQIAYDAIPDEEEQYMQAGSFFGHHIGLSVDDPALLDEPLATGMVFTVEPWYYNHELEIAVFVEDVVVVTEDGVEILTRALARTPEELEALVR